MSAVSPICSHQSTQSIELPKSASTPSSETQKFLDSNQYTEHGIAIYEEIFGKGFISTGGKDTTIEFVKLLDLKPGQQVLNIGCGIGGGSFYMAQEKGVHVTGVDLSTNMLKRAKKDLPRELEDLVSFHIADIREEEYPPESFDVIYSRDTFLHIEEKTAVFKKMLNWLKPGGTVLISDYCHGEDLSQDFIDYVAQRDYQLTTVSNYHKCFIEAGFDDVQAEDRSEQFLAVLRKELAEVKGREDEFVAKHGRDGYNKIVDGWTVKIKRCTDGYHKWGLFIARK